MYPIKGQNLIGSNGYDYSFLAKHGDDLNLDSRVSEITQTFDGFLSESKITKEYGLSIRSYQVISLGHQKGIIEWISNLKGFKQILEPLYADVGHTNLKYMVNPSAVKDNHGERAIKTYKGRSFLLNI